MKEIYLARCVVVYMWNMVSLYLSHLYEVICALVEMIGPAIYNTTIIKLQGTVLGRQSVATRLKVVLQGQMHELDPIGLGQRVTNCVAYSGQKRIIDRGLYGL